MRLSSVFAVLCLVSVMGKLHCQDVWTRWRDWYNNKLKPCLRSCPNHSEFICGFDQGRQKFAVASSRCALAKRNACFDEDFKEIPTEKCLAQLKFHLEENKQIIPTRPSIQHSNRTLKWSSH